MSPHRANTPFSTMEQIVDATITKVDGDGFAAHLHHAPA